MTVDTVNLRTMFDRKEFLFIFSDCVCKQSILRTDCLAYSNSVNYDTDAANRAIHA